MVCEDHTQCSDDKETEHNDDCATTHIRILRGAFSGSPRLQTAM